MLLSLQIENFAIVKQLTLDFKAGLTAFTGETGAGKSIMIDALMLALGDRADPSVIRHGELKCDITATFEISTSSRAHEWLTQNELEPDSALFLRRVITVEGRSKSFVNGTPLPLHKVKELSSMLVDIHGQHQHQTLLNHQTHRQQLDNFGAHESTLKDVAEAYQDIQGIKAELLALEEHQNQEEKLQLLNFQIEELEALAPVENEMTTLSQEHQLLYHAKSYLERSTELLELLSGEEQSIQNQLNSAQNRLGALTAAQHKSISRAAELLEAALIHCSEAADEINDFAQAISLDPERLHTLEVRMSELHQTARKYQVHPDELYHHLQTLCEKRATILNQSESVEALRQTLIAKEAHYHQAALTLRERRVQSAKKLASEITAIIRTLGIPKAELHIELSPLDKLTKHGLDHVEYWVCTNVGTKAQPLAKIASGGELSRISLAIQMVTAQKGLTPTLLFDEVDVGIGGTTAALVGTLLRKLSERLQIFCVTHQPQVAACGHTHYQVLKEERDGQTYSKMKVLDAEERIDEIARMLGGLEITVQTKRHAQELITQAMSEPMAWAIE